MKLFPIQSDRRYGKPHPILIPWSVAEKAYGVYSGLYGRGQSLDRLAERGGFGPGEMDTFYPGWLDECSELMAVKRIIDNYDEFGTLYDPESRLPPLAQRVFDTICELLHSKQKTPTV